MTTQTYDAIVVGARIAGSTVAALLGDAGYKVLLIDRATFPSPTLSTHFFRGEYMLTALKRLGVLEDVLALGSPPLRYEYTYHKGQREPEAKPPYAAGEIGHSLSVRREPFDHILVRRAARVPSVDFREATLVTALLWEDDRVTGVRIKNHDGEQDIQARIVIGADGRQSLVARSVNPAYDDQTVGYRALYYAYTRNFANLKDAPPDGPEFSFHDDEIAYIFPSDDAVTCVALSINRDEFKHFKKDRETSFQRHLANHPLFGERFAESTPISDLLGIGPFPNYMRVPIGKGWMLVGDAGMHLDPWTGWGMDSASTHAIFLAEAILDWFGGAVTETDALATYHQRRNAMSEPVYHMTVNLSRDLRQIYEN